MKSTGPSIEPRGRRSSAKKEPPPVGWWSSPEFKEYAGWMLFFAAIYFVGGILMLLGVGPFG